MATRYIRIGSHVDIDTFDDGDFPEAISTDAPISAGTPVADEHVVRKQDVGGGGSLSAWPVGSVFLSVVATNPSSLLGYGTWVRIAEGQFIVGYKSGDPDFGTLEGTGGSKAHSHTVSSGTDFSNSNTNLKIDNANHLPPYFTVYIWKRTA